MRDHYNYEVYNWRLLIWRKHVVMTITSLIEATHVIAFLPYALLSPLLIV